MSMIPRILGQAVVYALIAAFIGVFANWPAYTRVPPDLALVKLSVAHAAQKKDECRRLTPEELEKLPPNMRKATVCGRERLPVTVELEADGETIYIDTVEPTGLSNDGPSRAYERFVLPPGRHMIVAKLRDTDRQEGYDYITEKEVTLTAGQSLAIDFDGGHGGFRIE
ncbi:MAG: hypothetical protein IPM60_03880 [Rhodospirillales bacterium]|nr:hypothetical protein [Rhodospirillales bacterium]